MRILNVKLLIFLVLLVLTLTLLQNRFYWAQNTFGRLLSYPEIRFHHYPAQVSQVTKEFFSEDIVAIENRGSQSAKNVYLFVVVPAGRVTRYDFICQEPYAITEAQLDTGRLGIWLERLTPGASAILYLWSATGTELPQPIEISITTEQGTVAMWTEPTAAEEVESYVYYVEWAGRTLFQYLEREGVLERLTNPESQ